MPEYADQNIELVEGEIVTMPTTNMQHGATMTRIAALLGTFVLQQQQGLLLTGDVGVRLERKPFGRDTVRGLDFAYLSAGRAPQAIFPILLNIVPDLAIEVMSPGNKVPDTRLKVRQLLEAGTQAVWIVHPDFNEVDVYTVDGMTTYREGDSISGGDILPGFEIAVADIFPR